MRRAGSQAAADFLTRLARHLLCRPGSTVGAISSASGGSTILPTFAASCFLPTVPMPAKFPPTLLSGALPYGFAEPVGREPRQIRTRYY